MKLDWEHYMYVFRLLIKSGFQIFKRRGSSLFAFVYPYTSLPTRYRLSEAYGIYKDADRFNSISGRTTFIPIYYNIFYSTERLWQEGFDGKQRRED